MCLAKKIRIFILQSATQTRRNTTASPKTSPSRNISRRPSQVSYMRTQNSDTQLSDTLLSTGNYLLVDKTHLLIVSQIQSDYLSQLNYILELFLEKNVILICFRS